MTCKFILLVQDAEPGREPLHGMPGFSPAGWVTQKNKFLKIRLSLECNWLGILSGQWEKELAQLFGREIKPAQAECVTSSLIIRQRNRNEEEASKEKSLGSKGGTWGVAGLEKQSYPPNYIQWPCVHNARQLIAAPGVLRPSVLPCSSQPMDCNRPPGSSAHGASLGKSTGVGCLAFLQGIFPTQGSNPGLPRCRQILY